MASTIVCFACSVALQGILDLVRHLGILWQGASLVARVVVVALLVASLERLQHRTLRLEVLERIRALLVTFVVHTATHMADLGVLHHCALLLMAILVIVIMIFVAVPRVLHLRALVVAHEVHAATLVASHRLAHRIAFLRKLGKRTSACAMASAIVCFACSVALQGILDLVRHRGILWQGASLVARVVVVALLVASLERLQHRTLRLEVLERIRALLVAFVVHTATHMADLGVLHRCALLLMAILPM